MIPLLLLLLPIGPLETRQFFNDRGELRQVQTRRLGVAIVNGELRRLMPRVDGPVIVKPTEK